MASPLTTFVVLLVLAFGPSLIYLRWLRNLEKYDREPVNKVLRAFIWGAVGSIFWVTIINLVIFAGVGGYLETEYPDADSGGSELQVLGFIIVVVMMAPLVEEAVKMWGVSSRAGVMREIDEIEDGMIYGGAIGLGFAATENLLYGYLALNDAGTGAAIATVMLRAISSTLLHTSAAAIAGYGVGRVLVAGDPKRVQYSYYLVAVGLHATFNGAAVLGEIVGGDGTALLSFFFVLGLAWFAMDFVRRRIHELDDRQGGDAHQPSAYGQGYGQGPGQGYGQGHPQGHAQGQAPGYGYARGPPDPYHRYPDPRSHLPPAQQPYSDQQSQPYGSTSSTRSPGRPSSGSPTSPGPRPGSSSRASSSSQPTATLSSPVPRPKASQKGPQVVILNLQGPGNRQTRVKVPTSLPLYRLLESARSHYHLPPLRYRLKISGDYVPFDQTVGQAGLRSDDMVSIIAPA